MEKNVLSGLPMFLLRIETMQLKLVKIDTPSGKQNRKALYDRLLKTCHSKT